jgi:predicted transcriptional regulator
MQTPREKELEERCRVLEMDYYELKDRYDQLCVKLKTNANDARNEEEGDRFLRTYARSWR